MKTPGFTAEASLANRETAYAQQWIATAANVVPQYVLGSRVIRIPICHLDSNGNSICYLCDRYGNCRRATGTVPILLQ